MVASRDDPRRDFPSDKGARLKNLDLIALVEELDSGGEARKARADDGDFELGGVLEMFFEGFRVRFGIERRAERERERDARRGVREEE